MATIGIAIIVTIAIIAAIINCPALTIRAQTTSEETQETESEQSLAPPSGASCSNPLNFGSAGQQLTSNETESEQNMTELESLAPYECNKSIGIVIDHKLTECFLQVSFSPAGIRDDFPNHLRLRLPVVSELS